MPSLKSKDQTGGNRYNGSGRSNSKKMSSEKKKKLIGSIDCGGKMENEKKKRCKSLPIEGTKYKTYFNKKFEDRAKWANPDPRKIQSFIPGTILKVYVKEGQEVKQGDNMLVLEAMKMKNRVYFPYPGVVKKVNIKEGDRIPKNFILLELE